MKKQIRTLILAGALSISSLLVGCQSIEQTTNHEEYRYDISVDQHKHQVANLIEENLVQYSEFTHQVINAYLEENLTELYRLDETKPEGTGRLVPVAILSLEYKLHGLTGHNCYTKGCLDCLEVIEESEVFDSMIEEYSTEESFAEIDISDQVTECWKCHSHNIDVVDNTGGYICLDCGHME